MSPWVEKKKKTLGYQLTDLKETKAMFALQTKNCGTLPRDQQPQGLLVFRKLVPSF